jgi:hypothetical protein
VSRRFLPTDVGSTPEETRAAYRSLYERGIIERVDGFPGCGDDGLALRVVVQGLNGSKHPAPFREETFGFPGARVAGKPTTGQVLSIALDEGDGLLAGSALGDDTGRDIARQILQTRLGEDRAFVESLEPRDHDGDRCVEVRLRYPLDTDEAEMERAVRFLLTSWLRSRAQLA